MVLGDPWIPRKIGFKVISSGSTDMSALNVCDLNTITGNWNVSPLQYLMWEDDFYQILAIPICGSRALDKWICHYSREGSITMKSAYKLYCFIIE